MTARQPGLLLLLGWLLAVGVVSAVAATPLADQRPPSFSVRQENHDWWLVTPDGRRFFSLECAA